MCVCVLGGGSAGLSVASTLANTLGNNAVAVVEPSDVHYVKHWKKKEDCLSETDGEQKKEEFLFLMLFFFPPMNENSTNPFGLLSALDSRLLTSPRWR